MDKKLHPKRSKNKLDIISETLQALAKKEYKTYFDLISNEDYSPKSIYSTSERFYYRYPRPDEKDAITSKIKKNDNSHKEDGIYLDINNKPEITTLFEREETRWISPFKYFEEIVESHLDEPSSYLFESDKRIRVVVSVSPPIVANEGEMQRFRAKIGFEQEIQTMESCWRYITANSELITTFKGADNSTYDIDTSTESGPRLSLTYIDHCIELSVNENQKGYNEKNIFFQSILRPEHGITKYAKTIRTNTNAFVRHVGPGNPKIKIRQFADISIQTNGSASFTLFFEFCAVELKLQSRTKMILADKYNPLMR